MLKSATFPCTPVTLRPPNLFHMDFLCGPAAIHSSTTTYSRFTKDASPNELMHPEISMKNRHFSYIVFLGPGLQSSLPSNILLCLYSIALLSKFFEPYNLETLRMSADPWALKGPKMLVKRPRIMKSIIFPCMLTTLIPFNLGHMDFLDDPVAIHSSTTPYSRSTQDAGPNELINPKKSMKNHQIFTYSFLGSGPAIFPAQ